MTGDNREMAQAKIAKLQDLGCTALCEGMITGVRELKTYIESNEKNNATSSLMLFTDGQANEGPSSREEILECLKRPGLFEYLSNPEPAPQPVKVPPQINPLPVQSANMMVQNAMPDLLDILGNEEAVANEEVNDDDDEPPQMQMQMQQQIPQIPQKVKVSPRKHRTANKVQNFAPQMQMQQQQMMPQSFFGGGGLVNTQLLSKGKEKFPEKALPFTISTFGFGNDHDADLLRAIAEYGNGIYFFLPNSEAIPTAIADLLGGLTSLFVKGISLRTSIRTPNSALAVHSAYTTKTVEGDKIKETSIWDIQHGESKDIVISFTIPKLTDAHPDPMEVATITLKYTIPNTEPPTQISSSQSIFLRRPARTDKDFFKTSPASDNISAWTTDDVQVEPVRKNVIVQRSRVETANAIKDAIKKANSGDFTDAGNLLKSKKQALVDQQKNLDINESDLYDQLLEDLSEGISNISNRNDYQSKGKYVMNAKAQSHMMQRSAAMPSYASPSQPMGAPSKPMYSTKARSKMKKKYHSGKS